MRFKLAVSAFITTLSFMMPSAHANDSIQGTYTALLKHAPKVEGGDEFHQFATITLRTVNPGNGSLKISANVRIFFGDWNSNEFFSYEYPDVPLSLLTRQISFKNDESDVSFVGYLKNGMITGEWFASAIGRVGEFIAKKSEAPLPDANSILVKNITGHYLGMFTSTNAAANLPERLSLSLVTTQDPKGLVVSGNMRFYLGPFDSNEYVETKLKDVQFNFYNRYITIRTEEYGITLKGSVSPAGVVDADVFADGFGKIGRTTLESDQ